MHGVEEEKRYHREQQQLAEPVLGEPEHAGIVEGLRGHPHPDRREDAGDENQYGRDQRREHTARPEQRPEYGFVGAFHFTSTAR